MMNAKYFMALCLLFVLPDIAVAQSCQVESTVGEIKKVQIDGTTWFAITRGQLVQYTGLKQSTADLGAELKQRDDLLKLVQNERDGLLQRLDEYASLAQRYAALQEKYDALNKDYQQSLAKSVDLNQQFNHKAEELIGLTKKYDTHIEDWRTHAEQCRQLATKTSSGGISFDVGLGATASGGSAEVAGILGVGIGGFKTWGFLQNDNSGILIGTSVDF